MPTPTPRTTTTTTTGGGPDMIMGGAASSYSSSSSYSGFPDYIGVESCVDMRADDADQVVESVAEDDSRAWRRPRRGAAAADDRDKKKEYPPLIPLLAQTENLHSRMPWVLKRHYTPDGRLVLTEEKVRHHEYFRAHRHDGRLTLQLITLDDEVSLYGHPGGQCMDENDDVEDVFEAEASLGVSPFDEESNENSGSQANGEGDDDEEEEEEGGGLMKKGISCGGGIKCLNYNSVGVVGSPSSPSSSCMPGMMPLPALRQVHS